MTFSAGGWACAGRDVGLPGRVRRREKVPRSRPAPPRRSRCANPTMAVRTVQRTGLATVILILLSALAVETAQSTASRPIEIGAVYPTEGGQGSGGLEEFRGLGLAAEYVNGRGGVAGRPIRLQLADAESWDAAPDAVERLARAGIAVVAGSYGSTISRPAADAASQLGLVFWETGAVGELSAKAASGTRVFRVSPTGGALGRAAVAFVRDKIAPRVQPQRPLRYAVTYVDDVYGRAVGGGAVVEIRRSKLPLAAAVPYDPRRTQYRDLVSRIARARADVLVVAAYLEDGVALRRALVEARVPLVANIGTSSSYCMPAFGRLLGQDAVGVFASDKPDGDEVRRDGLAPQAGQALRWATAEYRRRYGEAMSAPALAGFAGGVALFGHVLPRARSLTPGGVAEAARRIVLPPGSLPNGSGLAFAPPGSPDAGANINAASVIWEWIRPYTRAIVWPQAFANHSIVFP
jgi:ABC-type branched-subunit amino acid transport system substrate-binding protein